MSETHEESKLLELETEKPIAELSELEQVKAELKQNREQLSDLTGKFNRLMTLLEANIAPPTQEPGQTNADREIEELLEPYSPEQIEQAQGWVMREIGGRLKLKMGPKNVPEIEVSRTVITKEHRESGQTNAPEGFTYIASLPVYSIPPHYMAIILDDSGKYQTEKERLLAMMEYNKTKGTEVTGQPFHPNLLEHIFDENGKLKEKRRSKTGRKSRHT